MNLNLAIITSFVSNSFVNNSHPHKKNTLLQALVSTLA